MEIEEFMQRAVLEIKKNFGDNLPIETNITKGLHEITILGQSIYVDVFYEIYIKTDDLEEHEPDTQIDQKNNEESENQLKKEADTPFFEKFDSKEFFSIFYQKNVILSDP